MNSYSHKTSMRYHYSHPASMAASQSMSPKVRSTHKNRSEPIAIKRTRQGTMSHNYADTDEPNEYDMATWRMYHRIINHRMLQAENVGSASSTTSSEDNKSEDSSLHHLQHPGMDNEPHMHRPFHICIQELDQLISEMDEDDGIFQFDL